MTTAQFISKYIPEKASPDVVLSLINKNKIDSRYFISFKFCTNLPDTVLSDKLNITVKTFRTYRDTHTSLKKPLQEHVLILATMLKHGLDVFGSKDNLTEWLMKENDFFDHKPPVDYLDTISGIKFVDDRLTAMEYGDNV